MNIFPQKIRSLIIDFPNGVVTFSIFLTQNCIYVKTLSTFERSSSTSPVVNDETLKITPKIKKTFFCNTKLISDPQQYVRFLHDSSFDMQEKCAKGHQCEPNSGLMFGSQIEHNEAPKSARHCLTPIFLSPVGVSWIVCQCVCLCVCTFFF